MFNSKLYILIYILFNIYTINCQVLSKEKVLSLGIERCKLNKDCPKDSRGCLNNFCYYKYYCLNEECMSSTNTTFFYTKEKKKGVIVDSCTQEAIDSKKFSTPVCNEDTDCFSNFCVNHICMTNEEFTIIRCSNDYNNGTPEMKCKKNSFEKCETDNECFSNYCTKEKFCSNQENNGKKRRNVALFLFLAVVGFCGIILIYSAIYKLVMRIKRNKNKSNKYEEEYEE